jgi:hypothetical protein
MKSLKFVLFIFLVAVINTNLFSSVPPPVSGGNPTCWPPPCVPIDNGVIFLIIAGMLYGVKKIYDSRKKSLTNI